MGRLRQLRRHLPESGRDFALIVAGSLAVLVCVLIVKLAAPEPLPLKTKTDKLTAQWLPETVRRWEKPIVEMAKRYQLDPNVLAIIMTLESGGYSKAESEVGARGLMQITSPTGGDIAKKYLQEPSPGYNLSDPRTNIEFGAAYLAMLRDEFGEQHQGPSWNATMELIAAGYNGGPDAAGKLYRGEGLTDSETVVYSRDAFNMWRERMAAKSPTYERWLERGGSRLIDLAKEEKL